MNVLYKYCDQVGIEKILETLELKLPYISHVNDPLECLPFIYCPDDIAAMKEQCLRTFNRNHISPPVNWEQEIGGQFEKGEIQKKLVDAQRELQEEWNQGKGCLLSVSAYAKETVMWAHYAERHKGGVIGIDFDNISPNTNRPPGILMDAVSYSKDRPKINILANSGGSASVEKFREVLMTKSVSWGYEKEFRTIFLVDELKKMKQQELSNLRELNSNDTWFLRLNPASIKEVIFGLYTEETLKAKIRKLIERDDLQHIKLYQAEESETYTLNLRKYNF